MTLHYTDPWLTVHLGDCRAVMAEMEAESVHCVVTSPPYWGLRDYGTAGQLGLEPTPEAYVEAVVAVFREVRRVLRSDGTVWLNLGDSYSGGGGFAPDAPTSQKRAEGDPEAWGKFHPAKMDRMASRNSPGKVTGLKPKDLVGIPWRVAFALQADGWYLRSDIIWAKPNPMPESVTDRPTKSHEYLFLLTKAARYWYDADAVREGFADDRMGNPGGGTRNYAPGDRNDGTDSRMLVWDKGVDRGGRNLRSVWTVATQPYPGAHFATFPPKLIEPCIKAGCPDKVCVKCGAPWERIVERGRSYDHETYRDGKTMDGPYAKQAAIRNGVPPTSVTLGWRPTCDHETAKTEPGTVLDPFAGSGTTAMVANRLSRRAVLIDLNADYLGQVMDRNRALPLGLETA